LLHTAGQFAGRSVGKGSEPCPFEQVIHAALSFPLILAGQATKEIGHDIKTFGIEPRTKYKQCCPPIFWVKTRVFLEFFTTQVMWLNLNQNHTKLAPERSSQETANQLILEVNYINHHLMTTRIIA
jgi:hypothetical protein